MWLSLVVLSTTAASGRKKGVRKGAKQGVMRSGNEQNDYVLTVSHVVVRFKSFSVRTKNKIQNNYRDVAQFGRAPRSGRGSRKFESCHLDHLSTT